MNKKNMNERSVSIIKLGLKTTESHVNVKFMKAKSYAWFLISYDPSFEFTHFASVCMRLVELRV